MPASESHVRLATPPVACVVPGGPEHVRREPVFDAFGWCESDWLDWRRPPAWDETTPLDGSDPQRMVFVLRGPCDFLPGELARLHAFGLGLTDEVALAPWAIDVATDELYAHRVRPRDLLWLAADNLNALFWGLHDWAHFHNHGPFEERAWTELQCDASARPGSGGIVRQSASVMACGRGYAVRLCHSHGRGSRRRGCASTRRAWRPRG